jgi:oxygen-independent coproporphyrinogen-3 oxidase
MGLQACQNSLLNKLGRIHTFEDFEYSLNLARKLGFININADIIFGIPGQTFEEWQETISRVLAFDLTHISCYSLMIEEGTVFGRMKDEGLIQEMDEDLDRLMYHFAISEFQKAGFEQYEISNFSKPRYQCEHNMNYWERGGYIGIGAGAHSFIKNRRFANTSDVARYMEGIDEKKPELSENSILSKEEELSEKIILGLRLNRGIDLVQVSEEFQIDAEKKYKKSMALLLSRKLIERDGSVIKLTKLGFDLANTVFVEFI